MFLHLTSLLIQRVPRLIHFMSSVKFLHDVTNAVETLNKLKMSYKIDMQTFTDEDKFLDTLFDNEVVRMAMKKTFDCHGEFCGDNVLCQEVCFYKCELQYRIFKDKTFEMAFDNPNYSYNRSKRCNVVSDEEFEEYCEKHRLLLSIKCWEKLGNDYRVIMNYGDGCIWFGIEKDLYIFNDGDKTRYYEY